MKELGSYKDFATAFKVIYDEIKKRVPVTWQFFETIWIETSNGPVDFYIARDMMCEQGYLINGTWIE